MLKWCSSEGEGDGVGVDRGVVRGARVAMGIHCAGSSSEG